MLKDLQQAKVNFDSNYGNFIRRQAKITDPELEDRCRPAGVCGMETYQPDDSCEENDGN